MVLKDTLGWIESKYSNHFKSMDFRCSNELVFNVQTTSKQWIFDVQINWFSMFKPHQTNGFSMFKSMNSRCSNHFKSMFFQCSNHFKSIDIRLKTPSQRTDLSGYILPSPRMYSYVERQATKAHFIRKYFNLRTSFGMHAFSTLKNILQKYKSR